MPSLSIAVVAFDQISPFHLSVPCLIFGDHHPGIPKFDFKVCSSDTKVRTTAGFSLHIEDDLNSLEDADIVIVPSWRNPEERPPEVLLNAVLAAHQRGARIVGLCLGAYVLAEAGLLHNRRATTHWAYANDFALRYPEVCLDPDVLYVEDGNLLTSAGTAASMDCCLHIIRNEFGAGAANSLARRLVTPPHRKGGQAQFIEQVMPETPKNSRLSDVVDWVRGNLNQQHTINSLAAQALMSRRSFTRQFRQQIGMTVTAWLQYERLAFSQRLLETSGHTIETVARLTGFGSPESFRVHFRRAFGVSPTAWRQSFKQ